MSENQRRSEPQLAVIILAAGQGTRMRSTLPKVLHRIGGRPLLGHVLDTARTLDPQSILVVVRHERDLVADVVVDIAPEIVVVDQDEIPGTGRAVEMALAQVPDFAKEIAPKGEDQVVLGSGMAEIALGLSLLVLPQQKQAVGTIAAVFFTAIFPGNVSQWVNRRSAFGLDTDGKRFGRLFFQPLLVAWALWSTRSPR